MPKHRFYSSPESINGTSIVLSAEESHHLSRVLRLQQGDEVFAFDGTGNEYRCTVRDAKKTSASLNILESLEDPVESPLPLTLAQAIAKGEKFDLIVQKATELGVRRIVPLITDRTDVRVNGDQALRKVERWQRISLESLKQCGRRKLVEIEKPVKLDDYLASEMSGQRLAFSLEGHVKIGDVLDLRPSSVNAQSRRIAALVGPEGGWSEREQSLMADRGCTMVGLGPRTLRTETAGIVAVALTQYLLGDLS
ncbi:MAG: 16S rRNA (uracil(1498)-N(3))-methyltransferase [Blastocatellia bacterium]